MGFALSYGLGELALQVVDDFLVRLLGSARVAPLGASWAGWNLLLPAIALVVAIGSAWQVQLAARARPGWRRGLAMSVVAALMLSGVATLVVVGLTWRAEAPAAPLARPDAPVLGP